jgi:hypothetical protein
MATGYVAKWMPLLEAIRHVQRTAGGIPTDACVQLLIALRDGGVASRYRGEDVGGIAALIEGRSGGVPPARWYEAIVHDDGSVEFVDERRYPFPRHLGLLRHQIEVRLIDLLRYWPEPAELPETGEQTAVTAPKSQASDAAEALSDREAASGEPAPVEANARNERNDDTSRNTVSYADLKAEIDKHGQASEDRLIAHVKVTFPGKHVPREWVRQARVDLWGKPKIGRPKAQ